MCRFSFDSLAKLEVPNSAKILKGSDFTKPEFVRTRNVDSNEERLLICTLLNVLNVHMYLLVISTEFD